MDNSKDILYDNKSENCTTIGVQREFVSIPITLKPNAKIAEVTTTFCDDPIITHNNYDANNNICSYTISHCIKVAVTVEINNETRLGEVAFDDLSCPCKDNMSPVKNAPLKDYGFTDNDSTNNHINSTLNSFFHNNYQNNQIRDESLLQELLELFNQSIAKSNYFALHNEMYVDDNLLRYKKSNLFQNDEDYIQKMLDSFNIRS